MSQKPVKRVKERVLNGLKSRDVIRLIDSLEGVELDYDRLYYYERMGIIVPSVRRSQGRGVHRLYSVEDFIILRWLVSLQKKGISLQKFRNVIEFLKEKMPEAVKKPQHCVLITDGTSVKFFDKVSSKALDVLRDTGQYLFVFPVGKIIEQSEKAIEKREVERKI